MQHRNDCFFFYFVESCQKGKRGKCLVNHIVSSQRLILYTSTRTSAGGNNLVRTSILANQYKVIEEEMTFSFTHMAIVKYFEAFDHIGQNTKAR